TFSMSRWLCCSPSNRSLRWPLNFGRTRTNRLVPRCSICFDRPSSPGGQSVSTTRQSVPTRVKLFALRTHREKKSMSNLLEKTGNIVFLRAHDLGTGFGPPTDFLDVEAVFILNAINDGAYGFQLRNDQFLPARQAMFSLLRDAYVHNLPVTADFEIDTG